MAGETQGLWWASIKVSLWWIGGAAIIVGVPFCVVWGRMSWDIAFQIVTGSLSPLHPGLGPMGSILAFVGYLLVPAAVGAVASVWFTHNVQRVYGVDLIRAVADRVKKDLGTG